MKSFWTFLLFCSVLTGSESVVRFNNIKCNEFHSDFATFQKCDLKVVRRGIISLNIHVKLFQVPVSNVTLNLSLHKKFSGYRPFLYNYTVDFCKFQLNRKQHPFVQIFFDALLKDTNINHTCPYAHDIIVDNLILEENMFKYLPMPHGEYILQLKVAAYNDWKADVKAYIAFNSDFAN